MFKLKDVCGWLRSDDNKRQDLYQIMLEKFIEIVTGVNGQLLNPVVIISGYEMAIMQAMQTVFPDARIRGCMFHYGQVNEKPFSDSKLNIGQIFVEVL